MSLKNFAIMTVAGFIFMFLYEMVIHGMLLMPVYEQTPQLWRPTEVMEDFYVYGMAFQLATVAILAFIYSRNHEGKGIIEGVRFGAYLGAFSGIGAAYSYVYMPISAFLAGAWFLGMVGLGIGLGVIFSLLYKPE